MKKSAPYHLIYLLGLLFLLLPGVSQAQSALEAAKQHIDQTKADYKLNAADISDYVITDQYVSKNNGITHIYLRQRFQGIEVVGANLNINIDRDGNVINMGNRFIPNLRAAIKGSSAAISAEQAAMAAAGKLKLKVQQPIKVKERKAPNAKVTAAAKPVILTDGGISLHPIPAKLVYQPMPDGSVRLAWEVSIYETDAQHYWNTTIDATTGDVLKQEDLVIHDIWGPEVATDAPATEKKAVTVANRKPAASKQEQLKKRQQLYTQLFAPKAVAAKAATAAIATSGTYRIYDAPFETPSHGDRTLVTGKENAAASPLGWHNDGVVSYTITKGNNVHAYEDRSGANAGVSPDGGFDLVSTSRLI